MENSADANEIIPRLWLGNAKASQDEEFIKKNNITVVFNCTKNLPFSPSIPQKFRVPVDDNLEEEEIRNMELWSSEIAYRILTEYIQGRTILVHCMAGMQRSAASTAFFLIVFNKMRGLDAMKLIKSKRAIAFYPRANFGRSIDYFDRRFHGELLPAIQKI
jgi:predicted protein tyrosine phosphatase